MPSHNLQKITIDDLDIIGYSVAGEETVVAIEQLDVCFDVGKAPDQIISINNVLLTHGHMDHTAGLAYYLSHRNFCGQSAGTVLAPESMIAPIRQIIDGFGKLDGNPIPANLVAVKPGDEYQIKPNLYARVFATKHNRESVGYTIVEKRKKIKPEYAALTGPQIVELKRQRVQIDTPLEIPIVTYLGDTQFDDLSEIEYVANSKVLITECTFYTPEHVERAQAGRHVHVNEFAEMMSKLRNEHIMIIHTTQRTAMRDIKAIIKKSLPKDLQKKIVLLMDKGVKNTNG